MSEDASIRIAILDGDRLASAAISDGLAAQPGIQVAAVREEAALFDRLVASEADVVVLDLASTSDPRQTIRALQDRYPSTLVVATGKNTPATTVGRAVAAGAATYLPKPYRPEDLLVMVRELREVVRSQAGGGRQPARRSGAIIAVYSPKGGVGSTTIATSLAVALGARKPAKVAIVDLDLQFGDVGVILDLKGTNSIADILGQTHLLDEEAIAEIFVRHSSGVYALLAPDEPTDMRSVDVPQVVEAVKELRKRFDYVICDLWSGLEELALAVLREADRVVLVTTPEIPSLRHVRRVMNATAPLFSSDRTVVVANRASSKVGLGQQEMERAIGLPVAVSVPSDGIGITKAINEGMSVMDPRAHVRVAGSFHDLAEIVARDLLRSSQPAGRALAATEAATT